MKAAFNTGNPYTEFGQRITCQLVGNLAVFVDHDRMIDGEFTVPNPHLINSQGDLARLVLHAYEHGQYQGGRYHYVDGELTPSSVAIGEMGKLGYEGFVEKFDLTPISKSFQRY
jgi:hypothetical protein